MLGVGGVLDTGPEPLGRAVGAVGEGEPHPAPPTIRISASAQQRVRTLLLSTTDTGSPRDTE